MTAEPNVTTPTPDDMLALHELVNGVGDGIVTCGCWRCEGREPDGTLHGTVGYTLSPYRCEGEAWTPVDEHDGEVNG